MKKISPVSYVLFMMIGLLMMAAGSFVELGMFDAFLSVVKAFDIKEISHALSSMLPDGTPFYWCGGILIVMSVLFYFLTAAGNAGWFADNEKPDKENASGETK